MFKKPKRNFRTRRKDSENELAQGGEDEEMDTNNSRAFNNNVAQNNSIPGLGDLGIGTEKPKNKKKEKSSQLPKVPSVTSMLSFEQDDGDSETFQIKKPKHSRHIAKQLKKASQREKEEVEGMKAVDDGGPGVVEMQLGSDAEGEESEESDQERDEVTPSLRNILEGGQIPDAAMIHLIRKKRQQMAREMTEEFIPVDEKAKETSTSRLVREEDNDRSDEEEDGERLNFAVNSRETELRHIQDTILAAEEGSHSEGSDQESEWEKQQILKGVKVGVGLAPPPQPAPQAGGDYYSGYPGYGYGATEPGMFGVQPHVPISFATMPSAGSIDVKMQSSSTDSLVTVDQIKKALKERLEDMTSVHRAHVHERDDLASRFEASEANIIELDSAKAGLEERYRFFQEMRGYVRDLVECFNDKVPTIEKIEKGLFSLLKQCSEKLVKRRQEDIKDQSQDYVASKAALAPNLAAMNISGEDQAKQRRAAEREARRARRRRSRQAADPLLAKEHNDGMSTDDEVNHSEVAKYKVERERLMREAELLFDNVVDEFHEVHLIMSKFERWKREQSESYEEAYIGLCLPKLFTPLIRLKLVDWNPLENPFADVEAMSWYSALVMYGCHDTGGALLVEDSDIKLIPSIIEKVLLPKLTDFAESVWDPLSSQQTKNLAGIVRRLTNDYPTVSADSKNTQTLIKAIVLRMRKTLDDDVFMPLYPKQMLENRLGGPAVFFHRQFSSSVKLLTNMLQWGGVVSSRTQQELSLDGLLNRYLLLALHNSQVNTETLAKCETIVNTFPKEWFEDVKSDKTIPKLEMFSRYLEQAAAELHKATSSGRDAERRETRESLKRIARMLVNMHAIDHATSLAALYSLNISLSSHH